MDTITLDYTDVFDENKAKSLVFSKHLLNDTFIEKSLFALIVDGKSMEPVINDRAVVVADLSQKELINGKIYLVYYENKMWVKKYDKNKNIFLSINPEFSHLVYEADSVHIVSRVLLTFTSL